MNANGILVVDDDDNLPWVVQTQLEQMGYAVDGVADGAAAIESINKERPRLSSPT
jgi:CheY-like chemotaxis protein